MQAAGSHLDLDSQIVRDRFMFVCFLVELQRSNQTELRAYMSNGCGFNSTGGGQFRQRVDGDYKKNGADNYRLTRTKSRNPRVSGDASRFC